MVKMNFEKKDLMVLVCVVGLVLALLIVASKDSPGAVLNGVDRNTMGVTGNAEMTVSPDQAVLYVSMITEGKTADEAQKLNSDSSNRVIDALRKKGIDKNNIETDTYYLNKKTDWIGGRSVDAGYELRHTLKVTSDDVENAGEIADVAVGAGANGVDRISFGLSKDGEKEVRDLALVKASELAKEKAESITDSLNVKLGKIVGIQESNFYYTPFEYYREAKMDSAVGGGVMAPTAIMPEKIEVRSSITLTYLLG